MKQFFYDKTTDTLIIAGDKTLNKEGSLPESAERLEIQGANGKPAKPKLRRCNAMISVKERGFFVSENRRVLLDVGQDLSHPSNADLLKPSVTIYAP